MKARLLLANSAEVQNGLLYALGAGWTNTGPGPSKFAIVVIVEVAWDETSRKHALELVFEDADGQPIRIPGPGSVGEQALKIGAEFDLGRPAGATPGSSFNMPVAVQVGPVQFPPGRQCVAKALVDGRVLDELAFSVRAAET
jgi:hypothetical protein